MMTREDFTADMNLDELFIRCCDAALVSHRLAKGLRRTGEVDNARLLFCYLGREVLKAEFQEISQATGRSRFFRSSQLYRRAKDIAKRDKKFADLIRRVINRLPKPIAVLTAEIEKDNQEKKYKKQQNEQSYNKKPGYELRSAYSRSDFTATEWKALVCLHHENKPLAVATLARKVVDVPESEARRAVANLKKYSILVQSSQGAIRPRLKINPKKTISDLPRRDPQRVSAKRICLKCRHKFESLWAGNRICADCKNGQEWRADYQLEPYSVGMR